MYSCDYKLYVCGKVNVHKVAFLYESLADSICFMGRQIGSHFSSKKSFDKKNSWRIFHQSALFGLCHNSANDQSLWFDKTSWREIILMVMNAMKPRKRQGNECFILKNLLKILTEKYYGIVKYFRIALKRGSRFEHNTCLRK